MTVKKIAARQRTVCEPRILLPRNADMAKWSVVACDQFTSDRKYWEDLDKFVGDSPSTLRLILPECYLADFDANIRREKIEETMRDYYSRGLFANINSFVYVKRTIGAGKVRNGLMVEVDLECYEYKVGNKAAIRATEGTVEDRLPPRVKIRESSLLEVPHIMLLADDANNRLFATVEKLRGKILYDFELTAGGGHIKGIEVTNTEAVYAALEDLQSDMKKRYGEDLLLLVGDGNHSLAAAKKCYEQAKAEGRDDAELKRYALCEIVNIYDDGIVFEPIHRAVFTDNPESFILGIKDKARGGGVTTAYSGGKEYTVSLPLNPIDAVAFIQNCITEYEKTHNCTVDYIHGDSVVKQLGKRGDCAAIMLPPISKDGFTEYIIQHGVLPKKTFSMGNAEDKRYYLEARLIK